MARARLEKRPRLHGSRPRPCRPLYRCRAAVVWVWSSSCARRLHLRVRGVLTRRAPHPVRRSRALRSRADACATASSLMRPWPTPCAADPAPAQRGLAPALSAPTPARRRPRRARPRPRSARPRPPLAQPDLGSALAAPTPARRLDWRPRRAACFAIRMCGGEAAPAFESLPPQLGCRIAATRRGSRGPPWPDGVVDEPREQSEIEHRRQARYAVRWRSGRRATRVPAVRPDPHLRDPELR